MKIVIKAKVWASCGGGGLDLCLWEWLCKDAPKTRMSYLKVSYEEGDEYEGEWSQEGKRNGIGSLKLKSGAIYTGQFENGFFHGSGVLSFPDGSKYEGHFVFGKFQGYGVYVDREGMKFEVCIHAS